MNDFLRAILFLPEQASTFSTRADRLHFFILLTTLAVGTVIAVVAVTFIIRYRRRSESQPTPRITASWWTEVLLIGATLGCFLLWFGMGFRDFVWFTRPPEGALDVYVTAKQWMWKFTYPDGPAEVDVLRVPVGRPVRLLLTSRDVIHSFYVPAFRLKQDAVPGRYTQTWFEARREGRWEVLCAEFCGLAHSKMRGEVIALAPEDFERWREEAGPHAGDAVSRRSLRARGREVAVARGCVKCHSVDGSRHIGPTWRDLYLRTERLASGEEVVANEAYLTESMMDPQARVVAGFDPVMPSFRGVLDEGEAAALVEYIRSLRSDAAAPTPSEKPVYVPAP